MRVVALFLAAAAAATAAPLDQLMGFDEGMKAVKAFEKWHSKQVRAQWRLVDPQLPTLQSVEVTPKTEPASGTGTEPGHRLYAKWGQMCISISRVCSRSYLAPLQIVAEAKHMKPGAAAAAARKHAMAAEAT